MGWSRVFAVFCREQTYRVMDAVERNAHHLDSHVNFLTPHSACQLGDIDLKTFSRVLGQFKQLEKLNLRRVSFVRDLRVAHTQIPGIDSIVPALARAALYTYSISKRATSSLKLMPSFLLQFF